GSIPKAKKARKKGAKAEPPITYVKAVPANAKARIAKKQPIQTRRAHVRKDGSFALEVPQGEEYVLVVETAKGPAGRVQFPRKRGGALTDRVPASVAVASAKQHTEIGSVSYNTVNLGAIVEGDHHTYAPEINPLTEVEWDADGIPDYEDPDVDGVGVPD